MLHDLFLSSQPKHEHSSQPTYFLSWVSRLVLLRGVGRVFQQLSSHQNHQTNIRVANHLPGGPAPGAEPRWCQGFVWPRLADKVRMQEKFGGPMVMYVQESEIAITFTSVIYSF